MKEEEKEEGEEHKGWKKIRGEMEENVNKVEVKVEEEMEKK